MTKCDILLAAFRANIDKLVCRAHNSGGANQSAATFRELKQRGYSFCEFSPNRWGKTIFCAVCKGNTTHSRLLQYDPVFSVKPRIAISTDDRTRILELLERRDAFTGATITSTPEIDHKTPFGRLDSDIDAAAMTDEEAKCSFQLLTREHNLLKDRACTSCQRTNQRPPFLEVRFWYEGNEQYGDTCAGCGWFDGKKWRTELDNRINPP